MIKVKLGNGFYYLVAQNKEEHKSDDVCFGCCFNGKNCSLNVECQAYYRKIYKDVSQIRAIKIQEIFDGDF